MKLTHNQKTDLRLDNETKALAHIDNARMNKQSILSLSGLDLGALPPEIFKLTNLTPLNIGENNLKSLLPEISKLTNISYEDIEIDIAYDERLMKMRHKS